MRMMRLTALPWALITTTGSLVVMVKTRSSLSTMSTRKILVHIFWLTERDFIYLLFMCVSFLLNRTQLLDSFHQLFTASSLNPEQKEIATARTEFFAYSIPDETEEVSLLFPLKLNIHNSNRWVDNNHLILLLSFRFCAAIGQTTCSHVIGHVFPFWTIHWSSLQFLMVVWFSLLWLAQSQEVRDAITIKLIPYLAMI